MEKNNSDKQLIASSLEFGGSIERYGMKPPPSDTFPLTLMSLTFSHTDKALVGRYAEAVQGGHLGGNRREGNNVVYTWIINGLEAITLLKEVVEFMVGEKKQEVMELIKESDSYWKLHNAKYRRVIN